MRRSALHLPTPLGWRDQTREAQGMPDGVRIFSRAAEKNHRLTVMVGAEGPDGWCVTVSHHQDLVNPFTKAPFPGRLPTIDELREVRRLFVPDDLGMIVHLPSERNWSKDPLATSTIQMHQWPPPPTLQAPKPDETGDAPQASAPGTLSLVTP